NEFSSNIATVVVCLATNRVYNFLKMIFDGMVRNVNNKVSKFLMYPRRARIAQSLALPTAADEPASPLGDNSQGEACPTGTGLEAGQDRANIIKTSSLPHDSTPRVTSLVADEGKMAIKIVAQDLEISSLKARINILEDKDRGGVEPSGEDAPIKGRNLETGEEACVKCTEKGSNDIEELVNVLTSLDAAYILTSGVQVVNVPLAAEVSTVGIPTGSGMVPTASPIFTTASMVTLYSRHKGKEKMVESDTPKKKKLQEQINVQVAREMEQQLAREDQRRDEKITRDAEIARIHAKEELQMLIDGLDRNNETIAKYLQESLCKSTQVSVSTKQATLREETKRILHKQIEDFVPMGSKEEGERIKRKGLRLEQESAKKIKTSEEVSEEGLKAMMQLVPVEEATSDKEKELWVELKRLYEPDFEDQLWTHTQALMHDPVEWRLYDTCGVHHVLSRDQEIFMLVERDYPLRKRLAIVMISNKL
nr:hypothetical protein [Tanacetum cinerariifolium]